MRAATSAPASGASAQSAEAAVNAMTLARYTGRVPNRRARYAVPASPAPRASRLKLVNAGSIQDTDRSVPLHVIEGAVFEHHDDHVVDLLEVGGLD
jgi:hypothetical protein